MKKPLIYISAYATEHYNAVFDALQLTRYS